MACCQSAAQDIRLLEISNRESYQRAHLPEAGFVDWVKDLTDPAVPARYNLLPREQMEQLLSRLGIGKDTTAVLYGKLENRLATRMLWSLRYYSHQRVKILDEGGNAWLCVRATISMDVPKIERTEDRVAKVNPDLVASREFITRRLGRTEFVLIDGRPVGTRANYPAKSSIPAKNTPDGGTCRRLSIFPGRRT